VSAGRLRVRGRSSSGRPWPAGPELGCTVLPGNDLRDEAGQEFSSRADRYDVGRPQGRIPT
jgi:hypothetical protein